MNDNDSDSGISRPRTGGNLALVVILQNDLYDKLGTLFAACSGQFPANEKGQSILELSLENLYVMPLPANLIDQSADRSLPCVLNETPFFFRIFAERRDESRYINVLH